MTFRGFLYATVAVGLIGVAISCKFLEPDKNEGNAAAPAPSGIASAQAQNGAQLPTKGLVIEVPVINLE